LHAIWQPAYPVPLSKFVPGAYTADRNFGNVLIIWDRLLGTFQEEREDRPCVYGLNAQPVVQGTYNSAWHQVHHLVATLRLAASGSVPVAKALFTRVTGPGMVHPSVTDAPAGKAGKASGPAGLQGKQASAAAGRVACVQVAADATDRPAGAAASKCADAGVTGTASGSRNTSRSAFDASYPWEKRGFTVYDFYASEWAEMEISELWAGCSSWVGFSPTQVLPCAFAAFQMFSFLAPLLTAVAKATDLRCAELPQQGGAFRPHRFGWGLSCFSFHSWHAVQLFRDQWQGQSKSKGRVRCGGGPSIPTMREIQVSTP